MATAMSSSPAILISTLCPLAVKLLTNLSVDPNPGDAFGTLDVFVASDNGAGNFLWARQIGGDGADAVRATGDRSRRKSSGHGEFQKHQHFKRHERLGDQRAGPALVRRAWCWSNLIPSGNFLWARQGSGSALDTGTELMAVDEDGNILETGTFVSGAIFILAPIF